MVNAKSIKNLRPNGKGQRPRRADGSLAKSPGRPRTRDIRAAVLADIQARGEGRVLSRLYRERLDLYLAYGHGRPTETVLLGGAEGAAPVRVDLVEAARTLRRERDQPESTQPA